MSKTSTSTFCIVGRITQFIQDTGEGRYTCFKTQKVLLDTTVSDILSYDDKSASHSKKSTFAETDDRRVHTIRISDKLISSKLPIFSYSLDGSRHVYKIDDIDFSHNRDYIGLHWNRKYIRAIQAILNSTKGKVGRGEDFFFKAFGNDEKEFLELLEMPETFILYRFFFEWLDQQPDGLGTNHWRRSWATCKEALSSEDWDRLLNYIHGNVFTIEGNAEFPQPEARQLLNFYTNYRKDIITPDTELFRLKHIYDENPTIVLRRKK